MLALAGCAYACSLALHGNGFIAAFVGGLAFGAVSGRLMPFVQEAGGLVSLLVWLAFGAVAVVPALRALTWQVILYAVLSLTVVRMAPVAVALAGPGLSRRGRRVRRLVRSPRPGVGDIRPGGAGGPG